jgi:hypothetical protein
MSLLERLGLRSRSPEEPNIFRKCVSRINDWYSSFKMNRDYNDRRGRALPDDSSTCSCCGGTGIGGSNGGIYGPCSCCNGDGKGSYYPED